MLRQRKSTPIATLTLLCQLCLMLVTVLVTAITLGLKTLLR